MDRDILIEFDVPLDKQPPAYHTTTTLPTTDFNANYVSSDNNFNTQRGTLDESVWDTIKRDLYTIHKRLNVIIYPSFIQSYANINDRLESDSSSTTNDNSDLWAPLIFILLFSEISSSSNTSFSLYFVTCWVILLIGSIHLKKFAMLLSSEYEQPPTKKLLLNVSLFGYCVFPILLNSILIKLILNPLLFNHWDILGISKLVKLALIGVTTWWSYYCCIVSSTTTATATIQDIQFIHKLPILLLFTFLNWLNMI